MNRVQLFNSIRDIPYRIPLNSSEEDRCCNGKVKQLKKLLEAEGYQARYRVCEFKWSDMLLPLFVTAIPHEDFSTHVYLEVFINGKWVVVDPTWDIQIKSILPVNEWDGITDTQIAVTPLKIYSLKKSKKIMERGELEQPDKYWVEDLEFCKSFNQWLESVRVNFNLSESNYE